MPQIHSIIMYLCIRLLAAGSFAGSVGCYSAQDGSTLFELVGHCGGVTAVKFTHNGNFLVSGARKDPHIMMWDVRNVKEPVRTFLRAAETNQVIIFVFFCFCVNWL